MVPSAASAGEKPYYQKDEKALCFHGELLYEAKVLEVRRQDSKDKASPHEYRVHYKGWKNTWDDWVLQDRLRKFNDENRELAANLKRELVQPQAPKSVAKAATSKSRRGQESDLGSGRGSEERHSSVPAGGRGTKRGKDNDIEKVGPFVFSASKSPPGTRDFSTDLERQDSVDPRIRPTWTEQSQTISPEDRKEPYRFPSSIETESGFPSRSLDIACYNLPLTDESRRLPARSLRTSSSKSSSRAAEHPSQQHYSPIKTTQREAGLRASRRIAASAPKRRKVYHSTEDKLTEDALEKLTRWRATQKGGCRKTSLNDKPCSPASETTSGTIDYSELTGLEIVRDFEPPPGEEEYISKATQRREPQCFWAPLLGGTTMNEKAQILREMGQEGKIKPIVKSHTLVFFEDQNPLPRVSLVGKPKNPQHLDLPGSKTLPDAAKSKYHDSLVGLLNLMDVDALAGWTSNLLKKVPVSVMERLTSEALNCMPEQVLSRLPSHIRDKLPAEADYLKESKPNVDCGDVGETFVQLGTQKMNQWIAQDQEAAVDMEKQRLASEATDFACLECASVGMYCNLKRPKCLAYRQFGKQCSYRGRRGTDCYEDSKPLFMAESRYLGLDLTCPAIQRPLSTAARDYVTLNPANTSVPAKVQPKTTYFTPKNVSRKPMRKCTAKQSTHSKAWNSVAELLPTPANNLAITLHCVQNSVAASRGETIAYTFSSAQEETFHLRPSIRITIPDHLKNLLVDDWENVTKSLLLVPLPSKAPANFIIDTYFDEEKGSRRLGSAEADVLEEFCAGMKVYFEKSVGKILLYRFERGQLAEIRHLWESGKYAEWENKGPGDAYGAEHLCRMLVNLPELIAQTNMDSQSVNRLREEISKFCTWLARNSGRFFCAKYEKPTAEYIENAR